jgi:hypothetical protein
MSRMYSTVLAIGCSDDARRAFHCHCVRTYLQCEDEPKTIDDRSAAQQVSTNRRVEHRSLLRWYSDTAIGLVGCATFVGVALALL